MPNEESCANPLLLGWVKEWLDVARERNSKGVTTYKRAYTSLLQCPVTFNHPSQLQQLTGFGPKLCDRLTEKLKQHCEENGLPMPKRTRRRPLSELNNHNEDNGDNEEVQQRPAKKPRKQRPYVPALRSGPYALIRALAQREGGSSTGLDKNQLIRAAQPYCDSSFTVPSDPGKFYTAWSSMRTLIDKGLVYERGRPSRKYMLSDEGWEVAQRIEQTADLTPAELATRQRQETREQEQNTGRPQQHEEQRHRGSARSPSLEIEEVNPQPRSSYANVVADGDPTSENATSLPTFRPIRLSPGTFTVELLLDVREVRAKDDRDYIQQELTKKGVKPIMRALEAGDALWVAKCHDKHFLSRTGSEGDEVVLDWIVERKRLDDLIGSIKDGRFHDQKFRLKRSGIKNVVYIVEEKSMDSMVLQKYEEAVQSAIASTQVVNGYVVKKTQKLDDTIRYLVRMTMLLKKQYEDKSLFVIPTQVLTTQNYLPLLQHLREKEPTVGHYVSYDAFASMASKTDIMNLRDIYLKMLMCTKQVTGEKALEIQKRWKTPYDFVKAYERFGYDEQGTTRKKDLVFGQMGNLVGRKKIARPLSHRIAEIWGDV
ncbi:hypothetical protein F5Y16DRAFT_86106 [Xylariaceae sp. FL0255]|nr:hypothetical protein F5Y16DRAFT_86106 [Xylariaceae sp. FL0255]